MKVLIVDDEQLARDRLDRMVAGFSDYEVVGEAANGIEAVKQAASLQVLKTTIRSITPTSTWSCSIPRIRV